MTNFTFDIEGMDELHEKLLQLSRHMPEVSARGVLKWAKATRAILKSTPYPARNTKKMKWQSDKQRRFVMAAIRRGQIKVPYVRSGNLANRWKVIRTPTGAIIANSADYSVYVVGDAVGYGQNRHFHRGRWWKGRTVIDKEAEKLPDYVAKEIIKEWQK